MPICVTEEKWPSQCQPRIFTASQPKAATMCTAPHAETCPPPPTSPFLLAQNLSSKRIVPTDNVRPNLHNEYTLHQWLKG